MPRIRSIKPEMFQDEKLATLTPLDRLVWIGLISIADDAGRLADIIKTIDGFIFPFTDESSRESIEKLCRLGRLLRYETQSGRKLIQIVNWARHQYVVNPSKHVLPAPEGCGSEPQPSHAVTPSTQTDTQSSVDPTEDVHSSSVSVVGSRNLVVGTRKKDLRSTALAVVPTARKHAGAPNDVVMQRIQGYFANLTEVSASKQTLRSAQIDIAFAYWVAKYAKPRALLDRKRELRIAARLDESGGDLSELLYALDGGKRDKALTEGGYDMIETILRDRGNVERLANQMPKYREGEMHPMARKLIADHVPDEPRSADHSAVGAAH